MTIEQIKTVLNATDQAMNAVGDGEIFSYMLAARKVVLRELWGAEKLERVKTAEGDSELQVQLEQLNYNFEEEVAMWAKYPRAK